MIRVRCGMTLGRVCAALLVASASLAQAPSRASLPLAPDDVQAFVRAALADRLRGNDIPDGNLLQSRRIGVRDVMPQAHLALKEMALPQVTYELFLQSPADAQAEADRRNAPVAYLIVDDPIITGDAATLWLGVDTAIPRASGLLKLCCCTGKAEYRRVDDSWVFVKWSSMVCS